MKKKVLVTLGGVIALLAHTGGVYALLAADNVPNALVALALVGAILGAAVGFTTRRVEMAVTMILCGLFGTSFAAYFLDSQRELEARLVPDNIVRVVGPDEIPAEPAGRVVYLAEGEVRAELMGGHDHMQKRGRGLAEYRVAPIAASGWTPADPVVAWAAFETNDNSFDGYSESDGIAEWTKPNRAGFVLSSDTTYYKNAIADAEQRHGLISAPGAALFEWRDPEEERVERRNKFLLALLLTQAAWLLSTLRWWLDRAPPQPRKPATTAA